MNIQKIDWKRWKPRLLYGAFAAAAFLLSLRWTFPSEAMKERLILEAGARGWQIEVQEVHAGGLLGFSAEGVVLEDRSGLKTPIDDVTVSLRLLPLLVGKRTVGFDARVYDGRIAGDADLGGDVRRVAVEITGLELGRALTLRKASGMDLEGKLNGSADLLVPAAASQQPTGRIDLAVSGAGIGGGQLPIPGMATGITLPKIALGAVSAAVKLEGGKAIVEKLEARGGDAELTGDGLSVVLQGRPEHYPLFGKARIKFTPAFWSKPATSGFKGLAEAALASARTPDGGYQLQVFGRLGQPQARPATSGTSGTP
jgi:type II secretion system protein N